MHSARQLIVNADDFGMSASVDRGIIEAYESGIVTSTSILATGETFQSAVELAVGAPGLGVGVHLNFYRGVTLLPPERVPTLVRADGMLPASWKRVATRLVAGKLDLEQLEAELGAQIARVMQAGLVPTHLDSEKHLHLWPAVFGLVCRLASKHGIPRVRLVREPLGLRPAPAGLTALAAANARTAARHGIDTSDATVGVGRSPVDVRSLRATLSSALGRRIEYVVHPGRVDDDFRRLQSVVPDRLGERRERELATLADPGARGIVEGAGFRLVSEFQAELAAQVAFE